MRAMRARLMMKLMGIIVTLVLTVITARSCSGPSAANSTLNPNSVARNAIAGLCANQEADAEASGDTSQTPQTLAGTSQLQSLGQGNAAGLGALQQVAGTNLTCPTTTVDQSGDGS